MVANSNFGGGYLKNTNKKGFTLIELLAVIVILAIIALIAVPIVLNMIEDARKSAAVDSAYGYIKAVEYEIGLDELKNKNRFKDGKEDVEDLDINVKGTKPAYGEIEIKNKNIIYANMCINGYMVTYENEKAKAFDKCTGKYDKTGPEIVIGQVSGTTNSLTIPFEVVDNESEIKETKCYYGIDKKYEKEGKIENNKCVITELKNNTLYNYKIEATNAGGIKSTKEGSETTRNFEGLEIKVDTADWAQSKEITIIGSTEGAELQYQINAKEKDKWIEIKDGQTFTLKENGTIYARLYDGVNASNEVDVTILNIDTTAPENITISSVDNNATSIKINYTGGTDSESGTTKYICHYGTSESLGTTKELLETETSCEVTTNTGTKYYYKICAVNKVGLETCSSVGNTTTWVGIPSATYTTGQAVTYGGQQWLVVKDNGGTTTLISKGNIATGAYTSASSSINSYITNNTTFNLDKSLSKLTNAGLPTRVAMPANSSGTPFWTSTAGGNGYYILGKDGSTNGQAYTAYSTSNVTRYYASGIGTYAVSTGPYNYGYATAYANSAASSSSTLKLTNSIINTHTDSLYTSNAIQNGIWSYNANTNVMAYQKDTVAINSLALNMGSETYYANVIGTSKEKYIQYGAYQRMNFTINSTPATHTTTNYLNYCHQTVGVTTGSATLASSSASVPYYRSEPGNNAMTCAGACKYLGLASSMEECYNLGCNNESYTKEILISYYQNKYKGTTEGWSFNPGNWTTDYFTYNTTHTSDCRIANYYTLDSGSTTIGIRPVITVKER